MAVGKNGVHSDVQSLFIVESHPKLQEAFREKFSILGFHVAVSEDPQAAFDQYRIRPFHALIVDAAESGEAAVQVAVQVSEQADLSGRLLAVVLLVNDDQSSLANQLPERRGLTALVRPLTLKDLVDKLTELLADLREG